MMDQALFNALTKPEMPKSSHDENDVLLRDIVHVSLDSYEKATHVIIGCPQDIGVMRNMGRPGAAKAPDTIRNYFYKLKPPSGSETIQLLDLGNIDASNDLRIIHQALHDVAKQAVADGKIVMTLGGGNDISLPDAKAVHDVHPDYAAINLDAHLDMRISGTIHSGTPYRNLIDGKNLDPANFYEVGIQPWANSASYLDDAAALGVNVHPLSEVQAMGSGHFFDSFFALLDKMPLFVGLDMDSIRASDAPGVSAASPVGFTATDILNFAARCRSYGQTALFEISEVNPDVDVDDRTSRLAALILYTFIFGKR